MTRGVRMKSHTENYVCPVNDVQLVDMAGQAHFIPAGTLLEIKIIPATGRNENRLRHYWAELRDFCDSMPEEFMRAFWENLLEHLSIFRQLEPETLHDLLKSILGVKSIAYYAMEEPEFEEYLKAAKYLLQELKGENTT